MTHGPERVKTPIRPYCTALEMVKEGIDFGLLTAFYLLVLQLYLHGPFMLQESISVMHKKLNYRKETRNKKLVTWINFQNCNYKRVNELQLLTHLFLTI